LLQGLAIGPASANLHFFLGNLDREDMRPEDGMRSPSRFSGIASFPRPQHLN